MSTKEDVLRQAMELSFDEREEIAMRLMESISPPGGLHEDDPNFLAELDRRVEELRSGKVKGIPADEALARIRRNFKL